MSLTPNEASVALRDIEKTGKRSSEAFGYRVASTYFILWGVLWVVGYGATDLWPSRANVVWLVILIVGWIASAIGSRASVRSRAPGTWRILAMAGILFAFIASVDTIMWPVSGMQQGAFVPLLIAAIYASLGLWIGARYIVAGAVIAALTLGGYFYIHAHFALWMAAVGGGGLVLLGLWLRKA